MEILSVHSKKRVVGIRLCYKQIRVWKYDYWFASCECCLCMPESNFIAWVGLGFGVRLQFVENFQVKSMKVLKSQHKTSIKRQCFSLWFSEFNKFANRFFIAINWYAELLELRTFNLLGSGFLWKNIFVAVYAGEKQLTVNTSQCFVVALSF